MTTRDKEYATEIFRNKVLEALDEAAKEVFGKYARKGSEGALDKDLPEIFGLVDAQLERLSVRYMHPLLDDYIGSDKWRSERASLILMGFPVIDEDSPKAEAGGA